MHSSIDGGLLDKKALMVRVQHLQWVKAQTEHALTSMYRANNKETGHQQLLTSDTDMILLRYNTLPHEKNWCSKQENVEKEVSVSDTFTDIL